MQSAAAGAVGPAWGRQCAQLPALIHCSHLVDWRCQGRWYSSTQPPTSKSTSEQQEGQPPGETVKSIAPDSATDSSARETDGTSTSSTSTSSQDVDKQQATALAQDFAKNVKQALLGSWGAAVNVYRAATSSTEHPSSSSTSGVHVVRIRADELLTKTKQLPTFQKVSHALDQLNAVGPAVLTQPLLVQWNAFWKDYGSPVRFTLGLAATYALWSLLDATAVSALGAGSVPDYATLAPAGLFVAWLMWYLRQRYTLNPSTVYQLSMHKLTTNAGVMEVMGAPLVGSPWHASMVTGGGLQWTGAGLRLRSKRVHLIFPLRGSERRGLVCVEAKKLAGKIRFKLLSIDVPVEGGEERVYVIGGEDTYERGQIFQELRAPFVKAVLLKQQYEAEDETDLTVDYIEGSARRRKRDEEEETVAETEAPTKHTDAAQSKATGHPTSA